MNTLLKLLLLISFLNLSACSSNDGDSNIITIDNQQATKIIQNKYSKLPDTTFVGILNNINCIAAIFKNGYSDNDVIVIKEKSNDWDEVYNENMFEDIMKVQFAIIDDKEYLYLKTYSGGNQEGTISFVLRGLTTNSEYWISFSGLHTEPYNYLEMSSNNLKDNKNIYLFLESKAAESNDVKL